VHGIKLANVFGLSAVLLFAFGSHRVETATRRPQVQRVSGRCWRDLDSLRCKLPSIFSLGWHYAAAVFDNEFTTSQDLLALYLDGNLVASSTGVELAPGVPNSLSALNSCSSVRKLIVLKARQRGVCSADELVSSRG
jgi:hypothetical protein